jgi:hypothetical protein
VIAERLAHACHGYRRAGPREAQVHDSVVDRRRRRADGRSGEFQGRSLRSSAARQGHASSLPCAQPAHQPANGGTLACSARRPIARRPSDGAPRGATDARCGTVNRNAARMIVPHYEAKSHRADSAKLTGQASGCRSAVERVWGGNPLPRSRDTSGPVANSTLRFGSTNAPGRIRTCDLRIRSWRFAVVLALWSGIWVGSELLTRARFAESGTRFGTPSTLPAASLGVRDAGSPHALAVDEQRVGEVSRG